jgi:hypothetical protein
MIARLIATSEDYGACRSNQPLGIFDPECRLQAHHADILTRVANRSEITDGAT